MVLRELKPTDFETILRRLDPLTRQQIVELVTNYVPNEDAEAFAVLAESLSADAVRFVAARALLRLRGSQIARSLRDKR